MNVQRLRIQVFNDPMYAENGLVVSLGQDRPCWVIDPGLPPQAEQMIHYISQERLTPQALVLTHAHGDHIAGVDEIRDAFSPLPLYAAEGEWPLLTDPQQNMSAAFGAGVTARTDDLHDLAPGDELELDESTWRVLDVAGHSPAGRALYCAELKIAIVGDAVFQGSIGRVDFPHSNGEQLLRNIHDHLLTLPDDTTLISGHGPATTVAAEAATNPFLQDA